MIHRNLAFALSVLLCGALITACMAQAPAPVQPAVTQRPAVQETAVAPVGGDMSGGPVDAGDVRITIVYDNTTTDPQLKSDWGFAAVVEYGDHTLLFDTGARGSVLLDNMRVLGVDPSTIEAVVLSHEHDDHTGGLQALLDAGGKPIVYVLSRFQKGFKQRVRAQTEIVEVRDALEILPGVHTTGTIGAFEQALIIEAKDGAVMITGCAHPGVVKMVREGQEAAGSRMAVLIGGFHLNGSGKRQVASIIAELRQLGVQQIMPCHCTGEDAIALFSTAYGENYIEGGVGRTVSFATNN